MNEGMHRLINKLCKRTSSPNGSGGTTAVMVAGSCLSLGLGGFSKIRPCTSASTSTRSRRSEGAGSARCPAPVRSRDRSAVRFGAGDGTCPGVGARDRSRRRGVTRPIRGSRSQIAFRWYFGADTCEDRSHRNTLHGLRCRRLARRPVATRHCDRQVRRRGGRDRAYPWRCTPRRAAPAAAACSKT